MKSQPASTQSRSVTRSLWCKVLNLAVILSVFGWATEAIAQIFQVGSVGSEVAAIQSALGISSDGIYGDETAAAVLQFQLANGLEADGIAGPQTLRALRLDYLVDATSPAIGVTPYSVAPYSVAPYSTTPYSVAPYNVAPYGGSPVGSYSTPIAGYTSAIVAANPYVVVIPGTNQAELFQARQFAPDAQVILRARRGAYIRAGSFAQRSEAESLSRDLRRAGLDARVAYRPR